MTGPLVAYDDRAVNSPFGVELILPSQLFRYAKADTGERRLMCAVLEDAVNVLRTIGTAQSISKEKESLLVETERWLFSDDWTWVFSAQNVCAEIGVNIDAIRAAVRKLNAGRCKPSLVPRRVGRAGYWAQLVIKTRLAYGWRQNQMARRIGCHETTLCNWERGDFEPAESFKALVLELAHARGVVAGAVATASA